MRTRSLALLSLLTLSTAAAACAPADEDTASAEGEISALKTLWADYKKLDDQDLKRAFVGLSADALSDLLTGGGTGIVIDPPQVFAEQAQPNAVLPNNLEVKALDQVVSGLAAQFGEKELGTEINKARLNYLKSGSAKYYVESAVTGKVGINDSWSLAGEGFDETSVRIGADVGKAWTSRVIVPVDDQNIRTLANTSVDAAKGLRRFVMPTKLEDVKAMKPGEVYALRTTGRLGANFGVGVPLLVAEPTGGLAYRIVLSAGVAGVIGGQVDAQVARLEGDEAVVDVGITKGKGISFQAAIRDGWGIKGICEDGERCLRTTDLGSHKTDLKILVEKAVAKRLNSYLAVNLEGGASESDTRVSLMRFKFHLGKGNQADMERAFQNAIRFNVRDAQTEAMKQLGDSNAAIEQEFDAVRAATTTTRNFGFELLGMNIYRRAVVERSGSFVLQTPEGAKSILFDTVHKDGGWFQRDHGFTRTGIAAQTFDKANPEAFKSEANLFVQTAVGDSHMDNDFIIDNIDATLLGIGGKKIVDKLDEFGNQMAKLVWTKCPSEENRQAGERGGGATTKKFDEECNVALLDSPEMTGLKSQGLAAIEPLLKELPADFQDLAREAATSRLVLQSVGIHNFDAANGPNASFTLDARFDDKALEIMMSRSKADYANAVRSYLTAVRGNRSAENAKTDKAEIAREVEGDWSNDIERMASTFEQKSAAYRSIVAAEKGMVQALSGKKYISYPLGLRFTTESLESGILESTSNDRAKAAAALFDALKKSADEINGALYDEHTAVYPLLQLVPRENLDIATAIRADVQSSFWVKRERYLKAGFKSEDAHAKGSQVSRISAGMFDLEAIINQN